VQHFIKKLNIVSVKPQKQRVSELSGGNQQKVVLGRLLGAGPKILLLDEPTRGIDIANKIEIHKIMGQMVGNGGAIIMVSSELEELIGICDRILILHEGNMRGLFRREQFDREAILKCMMGNGR
jgi:ABC-type sugar transport system ATPase subunit